MASEVQKLQVRVNDPRKRLPALYGLAVGISEYYTSDINLEYAKKDALDFASALKKSGAGLFTNVDVTTLVDGQATRAGIEKAFKTLSAKVQTEDVFVLFLAGHGDIKDGKYYFIPHEVNIINMDALFSQSLGEESLRRYINSIEAQKSLVLLDTCHSGAFNTRSLEQKSALDRLVNATGRNLITATDEEQYALEGYHGHGLFTHVLLSALGGNADRACGNGDGYVGVREIADYLQKEVPRISQDTYEYRMVPMSRMEGLPFDIGCSGDSR